MKSEEEAIEWVKRCPNPHNEDAEIEIRQIFEMEDFGAEMTPELREQEERLPAQVAEKIIAVVSTVRRVKSAPSGSDDPSWF